MKFRVYIAQSSRLNSWVPYDIAMHVYSIMFKSNKYISILKYHMVKIFIILLGL